MARSGWRTRRAAGDGGEQLLPVLKEDEIVDGVKRDKESASQSMPSSCLIYIYGLPPLCKA